MDKLKNEADPVMDEAEAIAIGLRKHVHPECFNLPDLRVEVVISNWEIHAVIAGKDGRHRGRMIVQRGTGMLKSQWHYGFVGISGHATIFELTHALAQAFADAGIRRNCITRFL